MTRRGSLPPRGTPVHIRKPRACKMTATVDSQSEKGRAERLGWEGLHGEENGEVALEFRRTPAS
jgi:hypothetical protein